MIHFMVDFENVRSTGLQGCKYLNADDSVTIFYSGDCAQIESGKLQQIIASGCTLDICKLHKTRKNALDYYIASKVGEIFGAGYTGVVMIVSRDKGFLAVQDYWKTHSKGKRVGLKPDIEQGIVSSGENSIRQNTIQNKRRMLSLEGEFGKYRERKRMRAELEQLFAETQYQNQIEKMLEVVQTKCTPKALYLGSLKKFGRKDGTCIYNKLKQVI